LFFTTSSSAQESIQTVDNCGVTATNKVIKGDVTICEGDIAFGVIKEIFPELSKDILPLLRLENESSDDFVSNTKERTGGYYGTRVVGVVLSIFYDLVVFFLIVSLLLVIATFAIRVIQGDKSWSEQANDDSMSSTIKGGVLGGALIIPYKGAYIGTVVVFIIATIAIVMANVAATFFISYGQSTFDLNSSISLKKANGVYEHNDYIANNYYQYLTDVETCRMRTSQFIISKLNASIYTPSDYKTLSYCLISDDYNNEKDSPSFVNVQRNIGSTSSGGFKYGDITKIMFGRTSFSDNFCRVNDINTQTLDYECGAINIPKVRWENNELIRIAKSPFIIKKYQDMLLAKKLHKMQPAIIENEVLMTWNSFKDELLAKLQIEVERQDFDEAQRQLISSSLMYHVMDLSSLFHQMAMNVIMYGGDLSYSESKMFGEDDLSDATIEEDSIAPLLYHLGKAKTLSFEILRQHCSSYDDVMYVGAKDTLRFLYEGGNLASGAHSLCIDLNELILNYEANNGSEQDIVNKEKARFEGFKQDWVMATETLSKQRTSIEKSFVKSLNGVDRDNWWALMRQSGYLAIGDYIYQTSEFISRFKKYQKIIINNFSTEQLSILENYISNKIKSQNMLLDAKYNVSVGGDDYGTFFDLGADDEAGMFFITQVLSPYESLRKDPLLDNAEWLRQQVSLSRKFPLVTSEQDSLTKLLGMWGTPSEVIKRLGVKTSYDEGNCVNNPDDCAYSSVDPLFELSIIGHDMVDMSLSFYAMGISSKIITGKFVQDKFKKALASKGGVSDATNLGGNKATSLAINYITTLGVMVDVIYDLLSDLMVFFLFIGILFAYIIPLIPTLFLYLTFISWLTVFTMSFFAVLLMIVFFIRFKSKKDMIKQAGFHYAMELLLKPLLSVVMVVFAYYFFVVIGFILNKTNLWVLVLELESTSFVLSMFTSLFILIMIATIYFVFLFVLYGLLNDTMNHFMKKLGVRNIKQDKQISDVVKVVLFDYAKQKIQALNRNANLNFGTDATIRRQKHEKEMLARQIENDLLGGKHE
jgi:hypothetical protein